MARGDHIRVGRFLYTHHGIDCGDGTVIHYTGTLWRRRDAAVMRTPLEEFAQGRAVAILQYDPPAPVEEVMKRAESRLEEQRYDLVFNNCEHFATWCMTGEPKSKQVRKAAVAVVAAGVVLAGGILVVAVKKGVAARRG